MLTAVRRAGTTLVELLAVLVLLAMVGGAVMRLAVGQRRFLDAVEQIIETERTAREGAEIPRQELRGVAATSGGIYEMAADPVDFRSLTGSSVI
jgi:type II secretory pathway pseudopilin PulG